MKNATQRRDPKTTKSQARCPTGIENARSDITAEWQLMEKICRFVITANHKSGTWKVEFAGEEFVEGAHLAIARWAMEGEKI
jgi:hypothetical protein